jgi:hypothetical protein
MPPVRNARSESMGMKDLVFRLGILDSGLWIRFEARKMNWGFLVNEFGIKRIRC